jgi:hypothetical protein
MNVSVNQSRGDPLPGLFDDLTGRFLAFWKILAKITLIGDFQIAAVFSV